MINRDRLNERVNLSTIKLELKRAVTPLITLALGFAVAGASGYYIVTNINGGIGSTHTMRFEVPSATGVVPGRAEVRFYGIAAGQVTDVSLVHGRAVLTATVADKFGSVYKDAQAEVRPNTALQDMYLDVVNRGTPSAGVAASGYVVPLSQTQSPVNLAEVLNTFQPDVRTQLYNMLDQLGNGLQDRGADLRRAFALLAPFLQVAGSASQQLAVRSTLTKQLVHNTSVLSTILASRSTQLRELITSGTTTLEALSTEGGRALRQTIAGLGPAMYAVYLTLKGNEVVASNLRRVLVALGPVVNDLLSGLDNLRALANSADPAVRRLQVPVAKLVPLAAALQPFARNLSSSLTRISPQVPTVDKLTTDLAACTVGTNEFFNFDASMAKFSDQQGPMVRGNPLFGFYTLPITKQSNATFGYGKQCDGGAPIAGIPTPKYSGPPPAP
jgi:ABC-type transporter Mla subunit MlaD